MASSQPGDMALQPLRALDPARLQAALGQRAAAAGAPRESFALAPNGGPEAPGAAGPKAPVPESFRRFEAMVLQTFIQNMLPRDGGAVYGKGVAGDMWKSQLAEKIADAIAGRGGIGIAERVLGGRYGQAAPATEARPAKAAADDAAAPPPVELAPAVIDEMLNRLNDALTGALSGTVSSGTEHRVAHDV